MRFVTRSDLNLLVVPVLLRPQTIIFMGTVLALPTPNGAAEALLPFTFGAIALSLVES